LRDPPRNLIRRSVMWFMGGITILVENCGIESWYNSTKDPSFNI
jgi:hypothetical protein